MRCKYVKVCSVYISFSSFIFVHHVRKYYIMYTLRVTKVKYSVLIINYVKKQNIFVNEHVLGTFAEYKLNRKIMLRIVYEKRMFFLRSCGTFHFFFSLYPFIKILQFIVCACAVNIVILFQIYSVTSLCQ